MSDSKGQHPQQFLDKIEGEDICGLETYTEAFALYHIFRKRIGCGGGFFGCENTTVSS